MSSETVVLFQPERYADRRAAKVPDLLAHMEVQPDHPVVDAALQKASRDVRSLVEGALDSAHLTKEAAARDYMRITPSLFGRQLVNEDNQHVSLQRLYLLPDSFWRELLINVAEKRGLARVVRDLVFKDI